MKVILLKPNFSAHKGFLGSNYFVLPNIGIGTIASILSNEGHEVVIKDPFLEGMDFEDTVSFITGNNIDIVGITTVTMHYEGAIQLAREVKKRCQSIITIIGGPHFQGIGEECLEKNLFFDYICVGEGDHLISDLIKCNFDVDGFSGISGLVYRDTCGKIVSNGMGVTENLDKLPFPAYDNYPLPLSGYIPAVNNYKRLPTVALMTSRGCPSTCTYCQSSLFYKDVRYFSVEYVINHLKFLVKNYGINDVTFFDDIFTIKRSRVYELCDRMIEEGLNLTWSCFIKTNRIITKDILKKMKSAGCWMVMPGIESGSPEVLKKIGKQDIKLDTVVRVCQDAYEVGIQTRPSFMLGNPGDTRETMKETVDFALSLPLLHVGVSYFMPLPGTSSWEHFSDYGTFDKANYIAVNTTAEPTFIPYDLEVEDLEDEIENFYSRFYFRLSWFLIFIRFLDIHEIKKLPTSVFIAMKLWMAKSKRQVSSLKKMLLSSP
jgi:anaerobic magnesium-protoporphyrin IX monomethyl ester cyclase